MNGEFNVLPCLYVKQCNRSESFFSVYLNNKKNTSSSLYQNLDGRNKYIQTITFSFLFAEKNYSCPLPNKLNTPFV